MPTDTPSALPNQEETSLSVICHKCGETYSLHVHTVCPECFAWPKKENHNER